MKTQSILAHNMFSHQGLGLARELVTGVHIGQAFKSGTKNIPKPHTIELKAVWDTGATGTSISNILARSLALDNIGEIEVEGVTGSAICNKYLVSLYLPNGVVIPELEVSDCEGNIGCDVLIGMDVITRGDFAVNNFYGNTTFTFRIPSLEVLDFTTQAPSTAISRSIITENIGRNSPCPCGSGKKYKRCCGKK